MHVVFHGAPPKDLRRIETKKAHTDLPNVPELVRVRGDVMYLQCGSARIIARVCDMLRQDNRVWVTLWMWTTPVSTICLEHPTQAQQELITVFVLTLVPL